MTFIEMLNELVTEGHTSVWFSKETAEAWQPEIQVLLDDGGNSLAFRESGSGDRGWQITLTDPPPVDMNTREFKVPLDLTGDINRHTVFATVVGA
ncbi:hypothetical protein KX75_20255 [Salmonella enterica subsp. enterica]|nr:hypothetical protein [Salmonella enterica subsp. enterica serovar Mikawasima]EDN7229206.1 hypothetical protein [Salmonella enterica subsp. enterica serovar Mikawasima]